jgi:PAS domain S-box-containing protein
MSDYYPDHETPYYQLFSQMVAGCCVLRVLRDDRGAVIDYLALDANAAFGRMVAIRREDVVGVRASTVLPAVELARWVSLFGAVADTGVCRQYEEYSDSIDMWLSGTAFRLSADTVVATFEDITAARRAEEVARRSQELHRLAMEAASLGAFTLDIESGQVEYSPEVGEILGLLPGGHLRLDDDRLYTGVFPEDRNKIRDLLSHLTGTAAERFHTEFRVVRPSGEVRWLRMHGQAVTDGEAQATRVVCVTGVVQDVTEHRRTAEAAAETEARLEAVFAQAAAGVAVVHGTTRRILQANDAYCQIVGRTRRALAGLTAHDVTHPDDREAIEEYLRDVREGIGRRRSVRRRYLRDDGGVTWADVAIAPMKAPDGAIHDSLEVIIDVTARKEAEDALEQNRVGLQAIWDHAPTMMCVVDERLQVICVNRAFTEGFRAEGDAAWEGCVGRALQCLEWQRNGGTCAEGATCDRCVVRLALLRALESGRSCRGLHFRTTAPTGIEPAERRFDIAIAPIDAWGTRNLLLCVEDVTDREGAVEDLRQSREQLRALAGRLQAAREEERARIAREIHDVLAQDLTRLKIDLVRLRRWAEKRPGADATDAASRIGGMCQLTDDAIATVQHIAGELRPPVLDSLGLCAAIEWYARDFATHTGVACDLRVPEECRVQADAATALYRILQESLTNVARHAAATRVAVELRAADSRVTLRVQDDGRGIPHDILHSPRSIGLAGMRERALLLGGRLDIRTVSGQGTCVEATFGAVVLPPRAARPIPST